MRSVETNVLRRLLTRDDDLVLKEHDIVRSALSIFRKRPSLTFSDCLIVELAVKAGHTPVGTFDRDLSRVDRVERL